MRRNRFTMRKAWRLALGATAALASAPALAGSSSATLEVSATVESTCNLDVRPLRFGTRPDSAPGGDAESTLAVACTPETAFVVTMDDGQNRAGAIRRMADAAGGAYLAYELYSDAARTRRWGANLAEAVGGEIVDGGAVTLPIYGRVNAESAAAGRYSDVVTVTVSF